MKITSMYASILLGTLLVSCEVKVKTNTASNKADMEQTTETFSFPMETGFSKEYLLENFWKCNYDSAGDSLAYWVVLPNNVKPVKIEPVLVAEGSNLLNIGRYERIDDSPYLEVWVLTEPITNNMQPADWLRDWLKASDETILHEKEVTGKSGLQYLDVLTLKSYKPNDRSISRCTVYRSGMNYFFIKVTCGANDYEALAKKIEHISSNWGIKN